MTSSLTIRYLILGMVVAGLSIGMLAWSIKHDEAVLKQAEIYEKCVREQYGMSPAGYYQEAGEYPICE